MLLSPHDLHHLLETYGYWAVAFLVGLESMGIPLPGETILIVAAAYASNHDINIAWVIAAAAVGAIIGDNIGYSVGRELGFRFLLRFGNYIGMNESRIKLGQYLFMRHGSKVVFFGRFVAVLRFLAAFLAGMNQMAWPRFLVANAAGGILWATAIGMAAYTAGEGIHRVKGPLGMTLLALAVVILVWTSILLRRNEATLQAEAERALPGPLKVSRKEQ
jgi:membrane protein DedA with SNARE-associated domain